MIIIILLGTYLLRFQVGLILAESNFTQLASILTLVSEDKNNIVIKEAGNINDSTNSNFWLNSGGLFYLQNNYGHTILGDLPKYSPWRILYSITNPTDTDNGYHPQNLLRLISRKKEINVSQTLYVLIVKDNLSQSPNRNESNGILLFSRFLDSNDLYYAGIRVDGTVIIKKKKDGEYYSLAQTSFFSEDKYDRDLNPSLLPKNVWLGIKMNTKNIDSQTVEIELFIDNKNDGVWEKVLTVQDKSGANSSPILTAGYNGIRSDFMDIETRDYSSAPII